MVAQPPYPAGAKHSQGPRWLSMHARTKRALDAGRHALPAHLQNPETQCAGSYIPCRPMLPLRVTPTPAHGMQLDRMPCAPHTPLQPRPCKRPAGQRSGWQVEDRAGRTTVCGSLARYIVGSMLFRCAADPVAGPHLAALELTGRVVPKGSKPGSCCVGNEKS